MIHHSIGASRRVVWAIAVSGPLLTIGLSNLASAGDAAAPDSQPTLRGSTCEGSDQDLAPPARAGCARISGYITAGERSGSDERIGGRRDPFSPLDAQSGAGGLAIVGAPFGADRILLPTSPGDIAR
jgi:hypothetical protein